MVGADKGNLRSSVFFIWGGLCTCAFVYAWFLVPETKGLTLEQVDRMMEETTPRNSSKWKPHTTFASGMADSSGVLEKSIVADVERRGSAF
jgi:Sugar (and other) transporter